MLDDLNETIKKLLIQDLKADGPIDVSFEQPTREWSSKINRPTVNFFLLKILENRKLRDLNWEARYVQNNQAKRIWPPKRVDIFYMVTGWATEPADEYHLLWRTLAILIKNSTLPAEFYTGQMAYQEKPVILEAAQTEILENPAEIWSALNNEFKPSISLKVTLEMDLGLVEELPLVLTKKIVFTDTERVITGEEIIQIGGTVYDKDGNPLSGVKVTVVERDQFDITDSEGHFSFTHVPQGDYTLEATAPNGDKRKRTVSWGKDHQYDFTL
jgi:hypothetical protein